MNLHIKYLSFFVLLILLSSCVGTRSSQKFMASPFAPSHVELQTSMDDYEFIAEKEISIEYVKYFGIFRNIRKVNDSIFIPYRNKGIVVKQSNWKGVKSIFRYALTDLVEEHPDIDVFIPAYVKTEKHKMFFGQVKKQTLKVKCYKYTH